MLFVIIYFFKNEKHEITYFNKSYFNKPYYKDPLRRGTQLTKPSTHVWIQAPNQNPPYSCTAGLQQMWRHVPDTGRNFGEADKKSIFPYKSMVF